MTATQREINIKDDDCYSPLDLTIRKSTPENLQPLNLTMHKPAQPKAVDVPPQLPTKEPTTFSQEYTDPFTNKYWFTKKAKQGKYHYFNKFIKFIFFAFLFLKPITSNYFQFLQLNHLPATFPYITLKSKFLFSTIW